MPQFKPSDSVKPSLDITGTDAEALDVTGGAEFGSGDVELIGVDGKIQGPISSTIIDDLSGANLTTLNATNISSGTLAAARLPAKVTVTSSDADALDVTGGLTIGSGDVALVGVDGKLSGPLSTTIIDDLSGANLTTLNASALSSGTVPTARLGSGTASSATFLRGDGAWNTAGTTSPWTTYATTLTDLVNSTTDTTVLTSTAIGAGDFTLGSVLIIWCTYTVNNQTGGNQTVQLSLGLEESGTYRAHQSNHTWEAPAATRTQAKQFIFQRKDADEIYMSVGDESIGHGGGVFGNPGNGNIKSAGSIDFSNACTPIVKVKFATANANLGIDMHSGCVALITAGT
tara:strand:- start:9352 stop:10383 length:1032 start_codon:yes stop_codon:yes gene_type:complete